MPDADYIPFNMDCSHCEHEPICFMMLKVVNKVSYQWFRYLKIKDREHFCRQGRKRRYSIQTHFKENPPEVQPIASILDRRNKVLPV